jgi:hypothetical protein
MLNLFFCFRFWVSYSELAFLGTVKSNCNIDRSVYEFDYEVDLFTVYVKVARHLLFNLPLLVLLLIANRSLNLVLL